MLLSIYTRRGSGQCQRLVAYVLRLSPCSTTYRVAVGEVPMTVDFVREWEV